MSTRHTIVAEIETKFLIPDMPADEREVAYPKVSITFDYTKGSPAYTPRGEYGPIDPPEPPQVELVSAILIDGDGLSPTRGQVVEWVQMWLDGDDGFNVCCIEAMEDARWK